MVSSSTLVWPNSKVPPSTSPVARYNLRKFASEKADLDIDFAGSDQAEIVTAILAGCVQNHETAQPLSSDEIWLWSLKKRLQMLLVRIGGMQRAVRKASAAWRRLDRAIRPRKPEFTLGVRPTPAVVTTMHKPMVAQP